MVEPIPDMPVGALGFVVSGRVSGADYREVLEPALRRALRDGRRLRILFQLGPGLEAFDPGALWAEVRSDVDLGIRHRGSWERLALVTDIEWARRTASLLGFLAPGEFRVYSLAEHDEARGWIASGRHDSEGGLSATGPG